MERVVIYIKHNLKFLWRVIDWSNGLLFSILFKARMERVVGNILETNQNENFVYRRINTSDLSSLYEMLNSQDEHDFDYFKPHKFDIHSLEKQLKAKSFLMMGVFDNGEIIGYFFLRFLILKKCFVGRIIDKRYRGKGIGQVMNMILYKIAWGMSFRCFSTNFKT